MACYHLFFSLSEKDIGRAGFQKAFINHVTGYGPGTNSAALTDRVVRSEEMAHCDTS